MRWTCRAAVGVAFAALAACKSSSPSPPSCSAGQTVCAPAGGGQAVCSDLASDTKNCGRCGNACPVPDGGATSCASGACAPTCASSRQTVCTSAGQDGGSAAPFCTDTEADFAERLGPLRRDRAGHAAH